VQLSSHRTASAADRELVLGNYLAMSEGPDHLRRAARYYNDLIAHAPQDGAAYGGLSMVDVQDAFQFTGNSQMKLLAKAKREAQIALRSNPTDSNALTSLGLVTGAQEKRPDDALRYFNAAVAAEPLGELPRLWRAKYLLSLGDMAGAGRDFRFLSQNVPTSGYAVGQYGKWLVLNREYAQAIPVLEQAVALGSHPGFTRYWLARAYYMRGLDADAQRMANVLLNMYPAETTALVVRMHVEARRGDVRDAVADFRTIERAQAVAFNDPVGLAAAQIAMGNVGAAARTVRRYLASGNRNIDTISLLRTDPDLAPLRRSRHSLSS
jgi:tetratricopeptide (TPR) repeat protein